MPREFQVDETLSYKQLNHQSTSLVIPQLTRVKIHNSMYYKINLEPPAQRGLNMIQLSKTLIRDFGTCRGQPRSILMACGGVEFKCLLMKVIHIRPTLAQILEILKKGFQKTSKFDNKYIVVLILLYLRIQYYYLPITHSKGHTALNLENIDKEGQIDSEILRSIFKIFINDYRKVKSVLLDVDCWSSTTEQSVGILHIDEIVDWLSTKDEIWGIPLGRCRWCNIFEDDSSDNEDSSSEDSANEHVSDTSGDGDENRSISAT